MKKILVAVDSFKGSMTSLEAGNAIKKGIKSILPDTEVRVRPVADGGEGTTDALILWKRWCQQRAMLCDRTAW